MPFKQQETYNKLSLVTILSAIPSVSWGATLPSSTLPLYLLVIIGCIALIAGTLYLAGKARYLRALEKSLNERQAIQLQQSSERNEKLYNINNQLYEEIAKHEITEELLRETQDYLQSIINSMPSILIGVDRNGAITHWNKAAQQESGINHDQALGKPLFDMIDLPDIKMSLIISAIDKQTPQRREGLQDGHGSQARYRDITVYPLSTIESEGAVIRIDDITSRVRLENMIIQNEKMSSLGELAAGVAHEINNPLGTILQSLQNIQRRLSDSLPANREIAQATGTDLDSINRYLEERKVASFLESIKEAGQRAAQIVTNMLEFSRSHNHGHESIHLIDLLNRTLKLAVSSTSASQKNTPYKLSVIKVFPEECPIIYGSAVEIQQVILNLVSNAYHAFAEAYTADKDGLEIKLTLNFSDKEAIIIVEDNGPGMSEWTRRHIFDPFFTTKEAGKGTGLGLSVSYFIIVEHHSGSIDVDSELDKGTAFTIRLPLKRPLTQEKADDH